MAVLHSDVREACATSSPVAVLNLLDQSDGSPKGPRTQQSVNVYPAAGEVGLGAVPPGRGLEAATRSRARWTGTTEFGEATRVAAVNVNRCPSQARGRSGKGRPEMTAGSAPAWPLPAHVFLHFRAQRAFVTPGSAAPMGATTATSSNACASNALALGGRPGFRTTRTHASISLPLVYPPLRSIPRAIPPTPYKDEVARNVT
jgi:hypothetical protein